MNPPLQDRWRGASFRASFFISSTLPSVLAPLHAAFCAYTVPSVPTPFRASWCPHNLPFRVKTRTLRRNDPRRPPLLGNRFKKRSTFVLLHSLTNLIVYKRPVSTRAYLQCSMGAAGLQTSRALYTHRKQRVNVGTAQSSAGAAVSRAGWRCL